MLLPHLEYSLRPLPGYTLVQPLLESVALRAWRRHRQPPAPRAVKLVAIRRFTDTATRRVFVETGTFYGDMLAALKHDFTRLYSIELDPRLARRAVRRFARESHISIVAGDSGVVLEPLLRAIGQPVVLWLDGHYSGMFTAQGESETPVLRELDAAFRAGTDEDVVLIDDARLFGTNPAYPTVAEVERRLHVARPSWTLHVEDDMLRLHAA